MVGDLEGAATNPSRRPGGTIRRARRSPTNAVFSDDLPPGLEAPRWFGHAERGGQHQVWLEDLGSDAIRWRLDDYGKAGRARPTAHPREGRRVGSRLRRLPPPELRGIASSAIGDIERRPEQSDSNEVDAGDGVTRQTQRGASGINVTGGLELSEKEEVAAQPISGTAVADIMGIASWCKVGETKTVRNE